MDLFAFDAFTRRLAGSRREALAALALGVAAVIGSVSDADAKKKRKKKKGKKKKKKQCKSRCAGACCKNGTAGALLFPEDGDGCACCPTDRIWTSYAGVSRCCRAGTKAIPNGGISTNGGPCCPEAQYCNGTCCNGGYVCKNNACVEECGEREVAAQVATGGSNRSGDVTAEDSLCAWPGNAQVACITGYICTERFVCCRPEETPCGGYPGQHGACCAADEVCNPKFDADPDGHNTLLDGPPCLKRC